MGLAIISCCFILKIKFTNNYSKLKTLLLLDSGLVLHNRLGNHEEPLGGHRAQSEVGFLSQVLGFAALHVQASTYVNLLKNYNYVLNKLK